MNRDRGSVLVGLGSVRFPVFFRFLEPDLETLAMIEQLGRRHVGVSCVSRARYRVLFLFLPLKEGAEIDHAQLSVIPLIFITSQKKKREKSWILCMFLSLSSS